MSAIKFLFFVALAIACVFAAEERVKKDVFYGGYASPLAYSAGYFPTAYTGYAGYAGYPYSAGLYRSSYFY